MYTVIKDFVFDESFCYMFFWALSVKFSDEPFFGSNGNDIDFIHVTNMDDGCRYVCALTMSW